MNNIPNHLAIIMDGNGRWATQRGMTRSQGHLEGSKNLKQLALDLFDEGLNYLSVFAFSTENFKRDQKEVDYLMNLFISMFNKEFKVFKEKNIKIIFSGREHPLKEKVLKAMRKIEEETGMNTGGVLNICLNYGGQEEIIDAAIKIGQVGITELSKEDFYKYLYNDLPPIDLVIRTSGEMRISNFMLYQMAYAELYFTETYFPGFKIEEALDIFEQFKKRDRRFGGNSKKGEK